MRARDGIRAARAPLGPPRSTRAASIGKRYPLPPNVHQFSWQVDISLFERLAAEATKQERSTAALLRIIVREYLERAEADRGLQ